MQLAKSLFSELYAVALRISLNYRLPSKIFNSMSLFYRSAFLMFSVNKHTAWSDRQTPKAPKAERPFGLGCIWSHLSASLYAVQGDRVEGGRGDRILVKLLKYDHKVTIFLS